VRPPSALESLRVQVQQIEGRHRRATTVLPFGIAAVDSRLPGGGLRADDGEDPLSGSQRWFLHGIFG